MTTSPSNSAPARDASLEAAPPLRVWRHRFACFHVLATFVLLLAGARVTSHDAGISVTDWPSSLGFFNPVAVHLRGLMHGLVAIEHGHREVAGFVAILTVVLAAWLWTTAERPIERLLGVLLVVVVLLQAALGGLTVLLKLPAITSIGHGLLAQTFFCLSIATAWTLSKEWRAATGRGAAPESRALRRAALLAAVAVYVQLLLGAIVRHTVAKWRVPSFGDLPVLLHVVFAAVVVAAIGRLVARVMSLRGTDPRFVRPALVLGLLVIAQLVVGLLAVATRTDPLVTELHVVTGAAILGTSLLLVLRTVPPPDRARAVKSSRPGDWLELTKPRIVAASALAALAGYLAGAPRVDAVALLFTLLGVTAVTAAAGVLNQVLERDVDARMPRTANRPLPSGRIGVGVAWALGLALAAGSLALLAARVNALTAALAFLALGSYLFIYTPLKRVTSLNTFVGAVPGALPPVLGWTAATGELGLGAFALFALLFLWQLPHFLSIAWIYRADYARGGLVMLPAHDPDGRLTARQACVHAVSLYLVSLLPFWLRMAGPVYLVGALLLGALFLVPAFRFLRAPADASARVLLRASLVYLPVLLCLIALGR